MFSTQPYDREFFEEAQKHFHHEWVYFEPRLMLETVSLAAGSQAVCVFVNDQLDAPVIEELARMGIRLVALRCAGFNNVDLRGAHEKGIAVVRVPAYSPSAVAEHTVGMILCLSRKFHRAYARVREGNFSLQGLIGFELHEKKVGIAGLGRIGMAVAKILKSFGCEVIGYDPLLSQPSRDLDFPLVSLDTLLEESDVITLHCPLTPDTHHLIDRRSLAKMKNGVMLINTSRGGLIDTYAVIRAMKDRKIGYLGLDVYEEEEDIFFQDLSGSVIQDDQFARDRKSVV